MQSTRILILRHFILKIVFKNGDQLDQELLFVDEDEGDDNESSHKDAPAETQSQVPQNGVNYRLKKIYI